MFGVAGSDDGALHSSTRVYGRSPTRDTLATMTREVQDFRYDVLHLTFHGNVACSPRRRVSL